VSADRREEIPVRGRGSPDHSQASSKSLRWSPIPSIENPLARPAGSRAAAGDAERPACGDRSAPRDRVDVCDRLRGGTSETRDRS